MKINKYYLKIIFALAALAAPLFIYAQIIDDESELQEHNVFIDKVLVSDDNIQSGKVQLIQVTLGNRTNKKERVRVRVRVQSPAGDSDFLEPTTALLIGRGIEPALFRYKTHDDLQGTYKISAYIYELRSNKLISRLSGDDSTNFTSRLLLDDTDQQNDPNSSEIEGQKREERDLNDIIISDLDIPDANIDVFYEEGEEGRAPRTAEGSEQNGASGFESSGQSSRTNGSAGSQAAKEAAQNLPELVWQDLKIINNSLIRGESTSLTVYLTNNGRKIAENVSYKFYMTTEFLQNNYKNTPVIFSGAYSFIAPGETKLIQIPIETAQSQGTGRFLITGVADPENLIKELNEENNVAVSNLLDISEVALLDPQENVTVAPSALLTFTWRSNQYNLFFVEISRETSFGDPDNIIRLPSGEPTPLTSLSALKSEMDLMRNLAAENKDSIFYWRIVGFDSANNKFESTPRRIFISYQ